MAAPAKAATLSVGDFVDFTADISGVGTVDQAGATLRQIGFRVGIQNVVTSPVNNFASVELSLGATQGGTDIGTVHGFFRDFVNSVSLFPTAERSKLSNEIFGRVRVTSGQFDLTGDVQFVFLAGFTQAFNNRIEINATQLSPKALPAPLLLLLSALCAISVLTRRKKALTTPSDLACFG